MIGNLHSIVLDSADIKGLAGFYRQLAGLSEHYADDYWITLLTSEGRRVAFQLAPDHVKPQWPSQDRPQQYHLDFQVPDLEAAVAQAIELGATRLPGGGDTYTVLADPSGHPFCLCKSDDVTSTRLADVAIDVPDGKAVAPFYAELLGGAVLWEGDEGAMVGGEGQLTVMFQNVSGFNPPRWPDPAHPQQFHLDVMVEDLDAGEEQVLKLGATKLPGGGDSFRVFADPVGHPFCLVAD